MNQRLWLACCGYAFIQIGALQNFSYAAEDERLHPHLIAKNQPNLLDRDYLAGGTASQRFSQPLPEDAIPAERSIELLPPSPQPTPPPLVTEPETEIQIQKIEVERPRSVAERSQDSVLSHDQINQITKPFEGKKVTYRSLRTIVDQITQLYIERGYITSRAVLREQTITDGIVRIVLVEGQLEQPIQIEGTRRLNPSYIRNRVQAGVGKPLNANELEEQLRLLLLDPLLDNVEASLEPGKQNQSILKIRVTEAPFLQGGLGIDNYSPPSVGSERVSVNLGFRNLTGIGDTFSGTYYRSIQGGSKIFDFNYRVPLNAKDGTVQFRVSTNRNKIVEAPFDRLNIQGNSDLYEVSYRQPIVRSLNQTFALSLGFTHQNGQTFIFNDLPQPFGIGPDKNGISRTSVMSFGQDYTLRDPGGAWSLRSQFNVGTGLLDATRNDVPIPDGNFFSWLGQAQRVQKLGNDHLLIALLDLQLTPDALLPSQQFVIGGGPSVRGYRQNARSGDNGFRFSLEDRIAIARNASGAASLQVAPFIDMGKVWNVADNPNRLPSQQFLMGAGLGVLWEPRPRFTIRLDYGVPLVTLDDRGNNVQDHGFYFSANYRF